MLLNYTSADDDLKFLFYYFDRSTEFKKGSSLSYGTHAEIDSLLEQLFILAKEEATHKKIAEFKRTRKAPIAMKVDQNTAVSVLSLCNYINIVKASIITGSLKHREYMENFTRLLDPACNFDPEFFLLDIRAGFIESIEEAEGMDKLYCEKVRSNKDYFICSGLRGVCSKEELLENTFLFLLNIKKAKFKTLESEGMICCTEGEKVEPLKITKKEGTKVQMGNCIDLFEDVEYGKIDFTKLTYKTIFSKFRIIDHCLTFKGAKVVCDGEFITTETENGEVR